MTHYLTEQDLILINVNVIRSYSPEEQIGIREPNSLNMTIESPKQEVYGRELYSSLELKAANLYRNIIIKYIFFNGNKRTAANALYVFLRLNGVTLTVGPDEFTEYTVRIATDRIEEKEIAEWLALHIK
ncbi:type II toxin-antitoxin system death-on-curing family toxin [Salinicoccus roseus]|uniref:type II toxin-antitoxin system death-on-curing family toxin n=1 Tax=Salinicoccus roseus TaxID=45670 RepID=UPI001EF57871|nr:type II toxin-antitoxin system death-on-curing family toxin [Salinicoccus roseus]MCG7332556.1 type II toxin-antitoxin system death-on-curing family toxin [Salinicoccus roseus]